MYLQEAEREVGTKVRKMAKILTLDKKKEGFSLFCSR
jgi:hypothetical protein